MGMRAYPSSLKTLRERGLGGTVTGYLPWIQP